MPRPSPMRCICRRRFLDVVVARYAGTRLGRQELDGEIVEERADALWSRAGLENCRVEAAPPLMRIVVAVDPPASASKGADACGLVAAGRAEDGTLYVIADETGAELSPGAWSRKAIALWRRLSADALVVEVNQGGDMVRAVIGEADPTVPVIAVRATPGQVAPRRTGGRALRAGPGEARRGVPGAGRRDVRLRPRRPVGRALAGPARCAGLGGDGADVRGEGRAKGEGVVIAVLHFVRDTEGLLMFDGLQETSARARDQDVAHRAAHPVRERRPGAVDAARLRGAGARGLCLQRDRASRSEARRRECRGGEIPRLRGRGAARSASAA